MNSTDDHNVDVAALSRPCLARLSRDVRAELTDRENVDRAALLENMKATAAAAGFDPSLVSMSTKRRGRPRKANSHDEHHERTEEPS